MMRCCFLLLFLSGTIAAFSQSGRMNIIPKPGMVVEKEGFFMVLPTTFVQAAPEFSDAARLFSEESGIPFKAGKNPGRGSTISSHHISFVRGAAKSGADTNAYTLKISRENIQVLAVGRTGALYGMHSLLQLLLTQQEKGKIPCGEITDAPRFSYRGMHLDVSRHFFPTTFIKKFISLMALYKMNTFHWHLTDGAGWRLEIKKYPELTSKAAWRSHAYLMDWWKTPRLYSEEGNPNAYGGYYTQQEAKEIVAYAQRRGITVVPEIEMPGHSEEVLATFPHLSCSGLPYKNAELCIGNEETFVFLENVLKEVLQIFPSSYIHIGGDEASKKAWKECPKCQQRQKKEGLKNEEELQSYAVRRMEKFLVANHRKLLGWDEILEGGLAPEATVMSWRGEKGGITAASEGHDVVMTPGAYCYFDSYQANPATQPDAIGGFLPLQKVYSYEPVPAELDSTKAKHVLGAQANIWTEYMPTTYQVEYMSFPRLLALAEVVWSKPSQKNWDDFKERLQAHYRLLQHFNVNYYRPSYELQIKTSIQHTEKKTLVSFESEQYKPVIRYTLDGTTPSANSTQYQGPFHITGSARVQAAIFNDTLLMGTPTSLPVDYHKAIGKKVTYNIPYSGSYPAQKDSTFTNGYRGSLTYGDGQWQGFLRGMDVTIDLEKQETLNSLSVGFMQLTGPGVYMPLFVEVSLSDDGINFSAPIKIENDVPPTQNKLTFKEFQFNLTGKKARYIRVHAKNQKGFLFSDEIIVY